VADAYLKPLMRRYVAGLADRLQQRGVHVNWTIMKSNGGAMAHQAAAARPVTTIMSGPAGGMIASQEYARLCGYDQLVTLDMGGTSCDVGLVLNGAARYTTTYEVEWGLPVATPLMDVRSIGAGGGSIAWIDAGGMLHVGPQSAGAEPGPACYNAGGVEPTVTDANLVLGYLEPDRFLGGRMRLHPHLAEAAVSRLGNQLGLSTEEAARAILSITNDNMANAIRLVTIQEGRDPREFPLLAFGGAGGLHAADIAARCFITTVLVPPYPGLFSALGLLLADVRVDKVRNLLLTSDTVTADLLWQHLEALRAQAEAELREEGYQGTPQYIYALAMRYLGQNYEHEVPVSAEVLRTHRLEDVYEAFHQVHERKYGYRLRNETIEIVHVAVSALGPLAKPQLLAASDAARPQPLAQRPIAFSAGVAPVACPVLPSRASFPVGKELPGPYLVVEEDTTILVRPQDRVRRTEHDVLVISVGGDHGQV